MVLRCRTKYLKDLLKIEYKKVNEGCSIEANIEQGDTRIVRANGQNYMDVFCQDFTMLLQHQKLISEELNFSALAYPENRSEFWNTTIAQEQKVDSPKCIGTACFLYFQLFGSKLLEKDLLEWRAWRCN